MCFYITATLPPDFSIPEAEMIASQFERDWALFENPFIRKYLLPGEQYFYTTKGHCDCGTTLGSKNSRHRSQSSLDRHVKKFRNKGWSEAKIERWLEEKQRPKPGGDTFPWKSLISSFIEKGNAEYVGILLHAYSGILDNEKIEIKKIEEIDISQLSEEYLCMVEEDVLYRFRR